MKLIGSSNDSEVYNHWQSLESLDIRTLNFGIDLYGKVDWHLAEIEECDLEKIYIISSGDWMNILNTDFKVTNAANALATFPNDPKVQNIMAKIQKYQQDPNALNRRFIYIAPDIKGNFTIIDGCKRSVALASLGMLVGNQIYLGLSPSINDYGWTHFSH